jgi:hypothetical protein
MAYLRRVSLADGRKFVAIMQGHIVIVAYAETSHEIAITNRHR